MIFIETPKFFFLAFKKCLVVNLLLSKGKANPNCCNNTGWSSLHHAAYHGHYKICKMLLEHGAKLHQENHLGATALHVAVGRGNIDILR